MPVGNKHALTKFYLPLHLMLGEKYDIIAHE